MRMTLSEAIVLLMEEPSYRSMTMDEISRIFGKTKLEREEVKKNIFELSKIGKIVIDSKRRCDLPERKGFLRGILSVNAKGYGFITREEGDVFIAPPDTAYAMNGDEVLYKITKSAVDGLRAEGYVYSIIRRNTDIIVGQFSKSKSFGFVIPDDNRIGYDIFIPKKLFNQAKHGDIVSCQILKYPEKGKKPEGMILGVIGRQRSLWVDIESELIQRKIAGEFPPRVSKQVNRIAEKISSREREKREIVQGMVYTIDGADAKDLDDAISVSRIKGGYELGVYIADVSHYVPENSALDKEALERGSSIYFADRVIPMLPEKLSNNLCSLNPNEEKLVLSLKMKYSRKGKLTEYRLSEGVIVSKHRLVYEDVSNYLESGTGKIPQLKDRELLDSLDAAKELADILREKRFKRGSIDFDFPETRYEIQGDEVIGVGVRETKIANSIIEEFMIAANETVAEAMYIQEIPMLYRVHEEPNAEKIDAVYKNVRALDLKVKTHRNGQIFPGDIQYIIEQSNSIQQRDLIHYSLLRAMQKAKYSSKETEHFGLASKYYTHFTSPIRRYPDLQIHRIIKEMLNGKLNIERTVHYENILEGIARKTSDAEMKAIDLERRVDDILACYYMKNHLGELFAGKIVNFVSFGIFVKLDNSIEGLIRYSEMNKSFRRFLSDELSIEDLMKQKYKIGDRVQVVVDYIDFTFREIILSLE